jgi:lantibiotic modifying enzyme
MKAQARLIAAAECIAATLCRAAYWHEGRCNWIGRSPREVAGPGLPITPTVTALGPELYTGTAGIALFLAELFARTDFHPARRAALGAIRQALWKSEALPASIRGSFYSGAIGIAYAAVRIGILLGEPRLVEDGIALANRSVRLQDADGLLDVIGGSAGAIAPLLWLSQLPGGEAIRSRLNALAEALAGAATKRDETWCWDNDRASGKGIGPKPLCGFAHGASGMGLALIEIGVRCGCPAWIDGGLAAFRYEDGLYDEKGGNWPDLREFDTPHGKRPAPKQPSFMVAWCHGAAGIGLARLRAYRLLPDRRPALLPGIQRAVQATAAHLQDMPDDADATPCHGRGGAAETLIYAAAMLNDRAYADMVVQSWTDALEGRANNADWPCGVASGRNNPSLMLGYAGIGHALLRAGDPDAVPSVLVIEPDRHMAAPVPHLAEARRS